MHNASRLSNLLSSYPRQRPPLSPAWQESYEEVYQTSRNGATLLYSITQTLESWMHRAILDKQPARNILEIGAGTLNHVKYENPAIPYDIVEPFRALYEGRPEAGRLSRVVADITGIPESAHYDRIVSIATLEHVTDLPRLLARVGLLLTEQGSFCSAIPSEGGFLWGASWRCSVGLASRWSRGLDYGELMRHEHVNEAEEILALVRHLFGRVTLKRFPLPLHHLSLYTAFKATEPDLDKCRQLLTT